MYSTTEYHKDLFINTTKTFPREGLDFCLHSFSRSRMVNIKSFWLSLIIIHHTLRVTEKGSSKYVIACQIINSIFSITLSSFTVPLFFYRSSSDQKQKHFKRCSEQKLISLYHLMALCISYCDMFAILIIYTLLSIALWIFLVVKSTDINIL